MTVARLKAEMPSSELVGWLAYFKVKAAREEKARLTSDVKNGLQRQRQRKVRRE